MDFQLLSRGIEYPYCIISDVHLHNWSSYSHTNVDGVNNRLQHILDAITEAVTALRARGGRDLIITGDLFHTRGKVTPSVFNPTFELFKRLSTDIRVHTIPGNHDLEGKHSDRLGNAVLALSGVPNFNVYNEPTILAEKFCFIPWEENHQESLNLATKGTNLFPNLTLFMHVGLSGVLPGNVGHTINTNDLEKLGAKYVFSGHFHNHANFNSRVYSVGALTHQTWGDVGSAAGYLLVTEKGVEYYETKAPKFVVQTESDWVGIRAKGNYVKIKDIEVTNELADDLIKGQMSLGALAVVDQSTRPTIIKTDASKEVTVDLGINTALESYCKRRYGDDWERVYNACLSLKS